MAAPAPRIRLDAEDRKAKLRAAARKVFARRGYAAGTLAEIADQAGVSKALLYHYYREGRPELYAAVMDDLSGELLAAVRPPASARRERDERFGLFVHRLLTWFAANRDAYAILVREPPGTGEAKLRARAVALQLNLVRQLGAILVSPSTDADTIVTVTSGTTGFIFNVVELMLTRQVSPADAEQRIVGFVLGGVERLELDQGPGPADASPP